MQSECQRLIEILHKNDPFSDEAHMNENCSDSSEDLDDLNEENNKGK